METANLAQRRLSCKFGTVSQNTTMKTKLTTVQYRGFTAMDRRFSTAMLPWLLLEIRKLGTKVKLSIAVEKGCLKAYNDNFEPVMVHNLANIVRKSQVAGSPEQFFYILWSEKDRLLQCYLFRAASVHEVTELFSQMKEPSPVGALSVHSSTSSLAGAVTRNAAFQKDCGSSEHLPWSAAASAAPATPGDCHLALSNLSENGTPLLRTTSNASVLTSLSADLSPSDSHFFEVLYIGKVKVSQRKVPDSLIDDALHKFGQHEADKARQMHMRRNSLLSSQATSLSASSESIAEDKLVDMPCLRESNAQQTPVTLSCTSTTPLEPDKTLLWKSAESLNTPKEAPEIDKEFDNFTKERAEKSNGKSRIKRPIPIALEPKVLILNVPSPKNTSPTSKNNLTTLQEDERETQSNKNDDLDSKISDTASSITLFCQERCQKDVSPGRESDCSTNMDAIETVKEEVITRKLSTMRMDSQESQGSQENITRKPKILLRSKTGLDSLEKRSSLPENKPFLRDRSASIGTLNLSKTPIAHLIGEQNRTMLFQVGRSELRLISPDRKQILLLKAFRDIASCVLGRSNRDHFGFICRETNMEGYVCYVFKCESDSIATEVINAIKQAFVSHAELVKKSRERSPNMTCEHCPMLWYHRLCHDVEGMNDKKTHAFILRRIEQLTEDEQDQIITKYQGGTNHKYEVTEHNAFLMMLLRAHCEAKQLRHVHDTAENRSEFLNQYLGGSTIFMKAKRSLSSGFDHLLKRKASKDDLGHVNHQVHIKKEASPVAVPETSSEPTMSVQHLSPDLGSRSKSGSPAVTSAGATSQDVTDASAMTNGCNKPIDKPEEQLSTPPPIYGSPIMDIFLKVGDTKSASEEVAGGGAGEGSPATWRQAIFQRVVSPTSADANNDEELTPSCLLSQPAAGEGAAARRTREQLRELWRMAIDQTLLLVRMERENARLRESEESSAVRRIKLEYSEMGGGGAPPVWDALLAARDGSAGGRVEKVDRHMLTQCVRQGVPRVLRGSIWYFLAEQACLRSPPPDAKKYPMYNQPYHTLLSGLTKHQHAILIDLGRTFPQHSYFASALGPGQLALYNLLKAYSLLDPDVGYCQGLSFVAGVLLLHMEEAEAFVLLRHLMFRRGLRKQYLPDMSALQVRLYQLSRLLRDHEPELHAQLERLDIAPALYAAPWMLTLFTSQFPLGFVVRVFDLIFLDSMDVVFAVSLALLSAHRDGLMLCESCEEAAEYLKHKLPNVDEIIYDKVLKKVFSLDISRQLAEYAVEYGVLREEMPRVAQLASLQDERRELERENQRVMAELDSAMESISTYQSSQSRLEAQMRFQEQHLGLLSRYLLAHQDKRQELPADVKRICQNYNRKVGFGSKFSSKFSSSDYSEDDDEVKTKSILKTGLSTPNLFAKLTKDDIANMTKDKKTSPENDRSKQYMMKKSLSVNSGLIATQTKQTLKVLEEKHEDNQYKKSDSLKSDDFRETLKDIGRKNSGFFANSHELIRQERLFAQQLKNDFDENLKRLDQKLSPNRSYIDNIALFQGQKSMSLNLDQKTVKQNTNNIERTSQNDSGFVTPLSPLDRSVDDKKDDNCSVVSHPLSDCDVDITFDGHSTQLKCLRPVKANVLEVSHSLDGQNDKNAS